jgi:3-oxoacyl-[acyl-carrier-protein] synthase-1
MNRVVITGYGIYSCIGKDIDAVKDSLAAGRSGIVLEPARKEFGYRSGLTGYLDAPYLKDSLDRRSRLMLPEQGEYAYISTVEALKNANLDQDFIDAHEVGIIFGNDSSAKAVVEATDIIREKKNTMFAGSGSVFQSLNSTVNMNLSTIFRLKGINFTVSAACASGSPAIGLGYHYIKHGLQ